mgnify:CR=1 FL=1
MNTTQITFLGTTACIFDKNDLKWFLSKIGI